MKLKVGFAVLATPHSLPTVRCRLHLVQMFGRYVASRFFGLMCCCAARYDAAESTQLREKPDFSDTSILTSE